MKTIKGIPQGFKSRIPTSGYRDEVLKELGVSVNNFSIEQKALYFMYLFRRFGPPAQACEKALGDWFFQISDKVVIVVWVSYNFNFQVFSHQEATEEDIKSALRVFVKEMKKPVARRDVLFDLNGESDDYENLAEAFLF